MWRQYRFALRSLLRRPGLTAAAVAALGLALGTSGTIFSLVDGLWLRPPGIAAPGELVRVFAVTTDTDEGAWSYPEVLDLQARTMTLTHVVARGRRGTVVPDAAGQPALVLVNVVSPNFFEALGVRAGVGRLPGASDREPVIAVGHAYWQARFGADPAVIGKTLTLGAGKAVTARIAGVLPASFRDLEPSADRDIWMVPATWALLNGQSEFEDRTSRWFDVVGRRARGQSVDRVATEIQVLASSFTAAFGSDTRRRARTISDLEHRLASGGRNIVALLALVFVVGLITCANIAELLLAGVAHRRREFATRVALGASRSKLAGGLVAEGVLLGFGGLAVGLLAAMWLMRLIPAVIVPPPGFRSFLHVGLDGRVAVFLTVTALAFTLFFSLAPARMAARSDLLPIIKSDGHGAVSVFARLRVPVGLVLQIALAFVLLSAAAILARSFQTSQSARFGLTESPVLTAWSLSDLPASTRAIAETRLRALPGVVNVALAIRAPLSLSGGGRAAATRLPGADPVDIKYNAVSANYFTVIGTPIETGRAFSEDDERARRKVAVVSRALAAQWPGGASPIGARFHLGAGEEPWEVVGVAGDAAINEIGEAPQPYIYLPFDTFGPGEVTFLLAVQEGNPVPVREVRAVLLDIDPSLEPRRLIMLQQYVNFATGDYRATATLAGALGALGLMLTLVGVYGVTAYRTSRRTREFGIRAALGAGRRQILGQVLRETFNVVGLGIVIGGLASLWTNRVIESLLLGVQPWDPWSLSGTAIVLTTSLMAATIGPALRAASVAPSEALRNV